MRILCKGFNLYNQLNSADNFIGEFRPTFELGCTSHFRISHTFSVICTGNALTINCNLAIKSSLNLKNMGKIKQIAVSSEAILILDDNGQLFKATIDDWEIKPVPKFVEDDDKVKIISTNSKLNVAYTENGFLYSIPEKLDFINRNIIDVQTGREHCILLDKSGNVYTFGAGSRGQLGTGQLDEQQNPVLVQALGGIRISKIAAGGWHSAAISEEGDLYMWGWNGDGQLGLASSTEECRDQSVSVMATPHVVDIPGYVEYRAVQVACGSKHTLVLLNNNVLYGCGWNKYKQLKNEDQENYHSFVLIQDFSNEDIDRITCGPWSSAVICK